MGSGGALALWPPGNGAGARVSRVFDAVRLGPFDLGPFDLDRKSLQMCLAEDRPPGRRWLRFPGLSLMAGLSSMMRVIRTGKLHALLRFHTRPINVVVYDDSMIADLEGGFPLRCFQRLSRPYIATLLRRWHDDRSTRGMFNPVLSY